MNKHQNLLRGRAPHWYWLASITATATALVGLSGCASSTPEQPTLASWDTSTPTQTNAAVFVPPKSQAEVQQAYEVYLQNAGAEEKGRRAAMERLAHLELQRAHSLHTQDVSSSEALLSDAARASLQKSVQLLRATIDEFPDAKDGDVTLYQLAQSYEKLGMMDESLATLQQLSTQYHQSIYFAEAQFRSGEQSFLDEDYLAAEVAYSDVVYAGSGHPLYEKALMKRGWSRLKQGLALEASEDFAMAIKQRRFASYKTLAASEKSDFDEYTRALTLAVRASGNLEVLQQHFDPVSDAHYIYHVYALTARLQLRNKEFAQADTTLAVYARNFPDTVQVAQAQVQQLTIMRLSKDTAGYAVRLEEFYNRYAPDSQFWRAHSKNPDADYAQIIEALRTNMLLLADAEQRHYRAQKSNQSQQATQSLAQAQRWYSRYLTHFASFARQDKVYLAYAELRAAQRDYPGAIELFEKAAYDGDIVLDKDAAYATIDLADKLVASSTGAAQSQWLDKLITYTNRSVQLYGSQKRYQEVTLRALQLAYNHERYAALLALGNNLPNNLPDTVFNQANYLKALAHLKLQQPQQAELLLRPIAAHQQDPKRKEYREALALAIYQQGQTAQQSEDLLAGLGHWSRLVQLVPDASIAADALYEAITLAVGAEHWPEAASLIEQFQRAFPKHKLYADATRQLSMVYLKTGATDRAARVFESIAAQDADADVKVAALWQAAELYEKQGKTADAIRAFSNYAKAHPSPFAQYMEAMHKLVGLYETQKNAANVYSWRHKIIAADRNTAAANKTDRTLTIAANAALQLAEAELQMFTRVRLVEPLADNLRVKRKHMQSAMTLYGQAAGYQVGDITLQSTYSIGHIYQAFSKALLESERPRDLSGDELEQYNMLLEDQAFPFEEKAIEFFEVNMARTADGSQGPWIDKSLTALKGLFASRYGRESLFPVYGLNQPAGVADESQ